MVVVESRPFATQIWQSGSQGRQFFASLDSMASVLEPRIMKIKTHIAI